MTALRLRLERLEQAARVKHRLARPCRVLVNPDAATEAEARAAGSVIVIRGEPYPIPPELLVVVDVDAADGLGSPNPDLTPVTRPAWFEM